MPARHEVPPGQSARVVHGLPLFVPPTQMSLRHAPFWVADCPVLEQKMPPASDRLDVPVVSGLRLIGMFPMN